MTVSCPTVHLNGTSKQELLDQLAAATSALHTAYRAMKRAAPNGRDYYLQGQDALQVAVDRHIDRLRRLDIIIEELEGVALCIERQ